MARRHVSIDEKAAAVAIADATGNQSEASRMTGVRRPTIASLQRDASPDFRALVQEKLPALAAGFATLTDRLLQRYLEAVDTLPLTDRTVMALLGVAADKTVLFSGQPTQIIEHRSAEADLRRLADDALARYIAAGLSREAAEERLKRLIPEAARVLAAAPAEAEAIEAELVTETEPAGSDQA